VSYFLLSDTCVCYFFLLYTYLRNVHSLFIYICLVEQMLCCVIYFLLFKAILMANIVNNFYTVRRDELLEINREWIVRFYYFALAALLGNIFVVPDWVISYES